MMKTKLKFFLVLLAMIVGGVNGAWAENVGTNTSTTYRGASTDWETIGLGKKLHWEFTNHSSKEQTYHNWLLVLKGIGGADQETILRADNYWWVEGTSYNKNNTTEFSNFISYSSNFNLSSDTQTQFKNDMDGAKVTIDISHVASGQVIVRAVYTNNGHVYSETLKLYTTSTIQAQLSVENAYLEISRKENTDLSVDWNDFTDKDAYLDGSKFEAQNSSTDWELSSGSGFKNVSNGWRTFSIKNLQNGDQVIITYEKTNDPNGGIGTNYDAATFSTPNAKTPTGDYVTTTTTVESETPYTITANGTLTLTQL